MSTVYLYEVPVLVLTAMVVASIGLFVVGRRLQATSESRNTVGSIGALFAATALAVLVILSSVQTSSRSRDARRRACTSVRGEARLEASGRSGGFLLFVGHRSFPLFRAVGTGDEIIRAIDSIPAPRNVAVCVDERGRILRVDTLQRSDSDRPGGGP